MKHPVSVAELLELHRLGELYVKWASSPVAMSEADLEELQAISNLYSVDGTSALFAFQKQFQQEFGLTAANTVSVQELAREVLAIAEAKTEVRYEEKLITNAVEDTGVIELPEYETPTSAELDEALAEQLEEDNAVDREAQAAFRADQLRTFRAELDGEMNEVRELEILREISNVDELTTSESSRLDQLLANQMLAQDSGTHKIPTGVLAEAIRGNEKGNG